MRVVTLVILFIIIKVSGFGQEVNSVLSSIEDFSIADYRPYSVTLGDNIFTYKEIGGGIGFSPGFGIGAMSNFFGITLSKINRQTFSISSKALAKGKHDFTMPMPALKVINGKLYFIYFTTAAGDKLDKMMAAEVDTATLETGIPRSIADIGNEHLSVKLTQTRMMDIERFFLTSGDGKKSSVVVSFGKGQYFVSVLDENMNVLWESDGNFCNKGEPAIADAAIDNTGNVYIAYSIKDKYPYYGVTHISVINKKGVVTDMTVGDTDGDVMLNNLKLLPSKKGDYVNLVAWYFDIDWRCIKGVFNCTVSAGDFKISQVAKLPFSDDVIRKMALSGMGYTDKFGIGVYGGVAQTYTFMGEDDAISMTGQPSSYTNIAKDYISYILVAQIKNGKAIFSCIPKMAQAFNTFVTIYYNNLPVVIYNDQKENLTGDIDDNPIQTKVKKDEVVVVAAFVNTNGSIVRKPVIDVSADNFMAYTSHVCRAGTNAILVPLCKVRKNGTASDKTRFGVVSLK